VGLFLEGATVGCNASKQNINLDGTFVNRHRRCNGLNSRYLSNVKR